MAASDTRFTMKTTLTPEQVRAALEAKVLAGPLLSFELGPRGGDPKQFRGELRDTGFTLVRRAVGRSSFAPIVTGTVRAVDGGSEVEVKLALPAQVTLFVAAWTLVAAGVLLWFIASLPPEAPLAPALALLPLPILAPAVGWLVFNHEVRVATAFLRATLPA